MDYDKILVLDKVFFNQMKNYLLNFLFKLLMFNHNKDLERIKKKLKLKTSKSELID